MAKNKLNKEQRDQLLEWCAADYSPTLIITWFAMRKWPKLTTQAISYYRKRSQAAIEQLRTERHASALNSGLALKAERVQRLKEHADKLDAIKWSPGENGRLWNEKAWREVLDDIAKEVGQRRAGVDMSLESELGAMLDLLQSQLTPEEYARIVAIIAGGATA